VASGMRDTLFVVSYSNIFLGSMKIKVRMVRVRLVLVLFIKDSRDVQKPNFVSVLVFKNPNRTEAKRSNPKFRFPLSHAKLQIVDI